MSWPSPCLANKSTLCRSQFGGGGGNNNLDRRRQKRQEGGREEERQERESRKRELKRRRRRKSAESKEEEEGVQQLTTVVDPTITLVCCRAFLGFCHSLRYTGYQILRLSPCDKYHIRYCDDFANPGLTQNAILLLHNYFLVTTHCFVLIPT